MVDTSITTSDHNSAPARASRSVSLASVIMLAAVRAIGSLPFSLRSAFGGAVGNVVGRLPLREVRIARLQLEVFLPEVSARAIAPKVFANFGRSILESFNLTPLLREPFPNIRCDDWERIVSWTKDKRPIIALTAHTGNWDLLAAYAIARGVPISTVGREARNPDLQEVLKTLRRAYGIDTIWRSDRGGIKRIIECFKDRRVMAALIDQDTRVDSSFVPFFGTPAKTPSALIELGKRCDARFVTAFIVRVKGARFEIQAAEIDSSLPTLELLAEYHRRLEAIIRHHPEQWVWFHKRWRTKESGETLSTKSYLSMLSSKIDSSGR
jgi:KDO2-lipid IV(A) lauroyltransferase